jgi:putative transposase
VQRYRRNYVPGGTYFFTLVTQDRQPILTSERARQCLRSAIRDVRQKRPFILFAIVVLPDHLHTVWTLPAGDSDYSLRWAQIKEGFTRGFLKSGGAEATRSASREAHRERGVWQRRFWEHTCRDEDDLKRCVDYLHWNPVKHGFVSRVEDYAWSSFRRFVRLGEYDLDWGRSNPCPGFDTPEWE